jgi:predicted metalloprotease
MLFGGNSGMGDLIDVLAPASPSAQEAPLDPAQDPRADQVAFIGDVLEDTQVMWSEIFAESDLQYQPTDLVIFRGATQSGCGGAYAQVGPHYCPPDQNIYVDLDFLDQLQEQFGAAGDTAEAYIVAHEVGHHIQNQLGVLEEVMRVQQSNPEQGQEAQIDLELQADCFAGVWLSTLRTGESAAVLEDGDLQEALNAASAVGDDNIQETTTGQVNPETWTHGSSEQRYEWLKRGFDSGDPSACDTFNA